VKEISMAETRFRSQREALGLPDKRGVVLALSFAKIAKADLRASKFLYDNKLYPHAVFYLQQSVDKSVKAVGLMLSLVRPIKEDLSREVGHSAIFGILIRRNERIAQLRRNLGILAATEHLREGRELFLKLGLPVGIPEPEEIEAKMTSYQAAKDEIERQRSLRPGDMWKITLEFNPNRPPNPAILKLLDEAESQWKPLDKFQRLFEKKLASVMSDPDAVRYIMNMHGKALPEMAALAFVTMWHESETRFPPIDISDYWDPERYKISSGLIKVYPRLQKHAKRLSDGAYAGAQAALRI
jgi:HEPN domain